MYYRILRAFYRPHTEYDGKVMFSVCLFTGGVPPGGTPQLGGAPPGVPPQWGGARPGGTQVTPPPPTGGGGHPRGYPPINLDKKCWTKFGTKNGQSFGQKMDKILDKKFDKHFGNFWRWGPRAVCLLRSRRRTVLLDKFDSHHDFVALGCVEPNFILNIQNANKVVVDQIKGCSGENNFNIKLQETYFMSEKTFTKIVHLEIMFLV